MRIWWLVVMALVEQAWGGNSSLIVRGKRDTTERRAELMRELLGTLGPGEKRAWSDKQFDRNSEEIKRRFSAWGGKRSDPDEKRQFSSWAGKRIPYYLFAPDTLDKKSANSGTGLLSWAGRGSYFKNENKRAAFSNWGGKRNFYELDDPLEDIKRAGFSNWDGKRSDYIENTDEEKRAFESWGGKRSFDENLDEGKRGFSSWGGKRSPLEINNEKKAFASWGGKRSQNTIDEEKRAFASWGGKRSLSAVDEEKRAFASWGGKRSLNPVDKEKRSFASWGGKRDYYEPEDSSGPRQNQDVMNLIKKAFASWGGKRNFDNIYDDKRGTFSSWGGKRSFGGDIDEEKRAFASWGGKRSDERDLTSQEKRKFASWGGKRIQYLNWGGKRRPAFSSWAGKRSESNNWNEKDNGAFSTLVEQDITDESELAKAIELFKSQIGTKQMFISPKNAIKTELHDVNYGGNSEHKSNKTKRGFTTYAKQYEMIKREPLFRAWIGKHYPQLAFRSLKRKQAFSSWGGKRSAPMYEASDAVSLEDSFPDEEPHGDNVWYSKRNTPFSSWGGKRSPEKRSITDILPKIPEIPPKFGKNTKSWNRGDDKFKAVSVTYIENQIKGDFSNFSVKPPKSEPKTSAGKMSKKT